MSITIIRSAAALAVKLGKLPGIEGQNKVLLIAGAASERANAELTKAGFTVRTGLRP